MKQEYVLGFVFDNALKRVLLIRKNRPEFMAGKLNGIGGKINPGEKPILAMNRECEEECGLLGPAWSPFAILQGKDWVVLCFAATSYYFDEAKTMESEEVIVMDYEEVLLRSDVVDHLQWSIAMAYNHLKTGQPEMATVSCVGP